MDFNSWLTNQGIDPDVLPDKERVREPLPRDAPQRTATCHDAGHFDPAMVEGDASPFGN